MSGRDGRVSFARRCVNKARYEMRRRRPVPPATPVDEPSVAPIPPDVVTPDGGVVTIINDTRDQISFGSVSLSAGLIGILRRTSPTATILPIPSHWLIRMERENALPSYLDVGRVRLDRNLVGHSALLSAQDPLHSPACVGCRSKCLAACRSKR